MIEDQYLHLLEQTTHYGYRRYHVRTDTYTRSLFCTELSHKINAYYEQDQLVIDNFPLFTHKFVPYKSVLGELLWFLNGDPNAQQLLEQYNTSIWLPWAKDSTGDLGPLGYHQITNWDYGNEIDQLQDVINTINNDPFGRRHLVSMWNPSTNEDAALPACHYSFQFFAPDNEKLELLFNMRSVDLAVGLPFNIASYTTLLAMVAILTDRIPSRIIARFGDTHVYENQLSAINTMLSRRDQLYTLPSLRINVKSHYEQFSLQDFCLENYLHHPAVKVPVAV